jgi:hypothetical protein
MSWSGQAAWCPTHPPAEAGQWRLGANAFGEILEPGRVPDCYAVGGWCELVGVAFLVRDLMSLARYREKPKE